MYDRLALHITVQALLAPICTKSSFVVKQSASCYADKPEDSTWKEYVEPLSDPLHPFNTFLASQAL